MFDPLTSQQNKFLFWISEPLFLVIDRLKIFIYVAFTFTYKE